MMLDIKTKMLIALGASVSANCHPCLQNNIKKAIQAGLTEQEIKDAIEVGMTIRSGAASSMDKLIGNSSEYQPNESKGGKCCC